MSKTDKILIGYLDEYINRNSRILHVGCDDGSLLDSLEQKGYCKLWGLQFKKKPVVNDDINIIYHSVLDELPFKNDFFNLVFTTSFFDGLKDNLMFDIMYEIHRCSRKYVCGVESYHKDLDVPLVYIRSFDDMIFVKQKHYLFNNSVGFLLERRRTDAGDCFAFLQGKSY